MSGSSVVIGGYPIGYTFPIQNDPQNRVGTVVGPNGKGLVTGAESVYKMVVVDRNHNNTYDHGLDQFLYVQKPKPTQEEVKSLSPHPVKKILHTVGGAISGGFAGFFGGFICGGYTAFAKGADKGDQRGSKILLGVTTALMGTLGGLGSYAEMKETPFIKFNESMESKLPDFVPPKEE